MEESLKEYLLLETSYLKRYLKNNKSIRRKNISMEELFDCVDADLDIVFDLLQITSNKRGFKYWKDSIFINLISEKSKVSVCTDIYPLIAKKYNKTETSVERAMRLCFEKTYKNISKCKVNFVYTFLRNYLMFPHNNKIICRITELICSREFQKEKNNLLNNNNQW